MVVTSSAMSSWESSPGISRSNSGVTGVPKKGTFPPARWCTSRLAATST